jgi:hypothetical protein
VVAEWAVQCSLYVVPAGSTDLLQLPEVLRGGAAAVLCTAVDVAKGYIVC